MTSLARALCILALAAMSTVAGDTAAAKRAPRPKVMVVGCENRIPGKKWEDTRINFGVTNLIVECLADNGGFALVEEKGAIREKLDALGGVLWEKGQRKIKKELVSLSQDPPIYAIGRLVYFGAPRVTASFGGVSASENKVIITAEVDLVLPDGETVTGSGRGEAKKTATSVLLTFREKGLFFEQTEVGAALQKAVTNATNAAIREYGKHVSGQ